MMEVMKMGLPAVKRERHFTYKDYKLWPDDERWELIDGAAYLMAAPNRPHQEVVGEVFRDLANFLRGKTCRVYVSPFDVLLPAFDGQDEDEVDTVVQPDVAVFCDPEKLTDKGATGAPDLAVEVLSPWTMKKDLSEKFRAFERAGVREYWVIDPAHRTLMAYVRVGDRFGDGALFPSQSKVSSAVVEGFDLPLSEVFAGIDLKSP
jgi:Uma2 family endonuclease